MPDATHKPDRTNGTLRSQGKNSQNPQRIEGESGLVQLPHGHDGSPIARVLATATGREGRDDPVLPGTGGPAGNAVLTAWTGLVLLVLGVAELLTLFDIRGLISWHVAIGALLVPMALLKTGSTGWRLVRYYLGHRPYVEAGPPVLLLRLLGPLVVASTVALLGTGILLILLGEASSRSELFTLVGFRLDWLTLHQAAFAVWAGATGLHLLARIVPALRLTVARTRTTRVPGAAARAASLAVVVLLSVALALVLVRIDGKW
jgi:hypothetical protein